MRSGGKLHKREEDAAAVHEDELGNSSCEEPVNQDNTSRVTCSFQAGPRASNVKAMEEVALTRIYRIWEVRLACLPTFFLALGLVEIAALDAENLLPEAASLVFSGWSVQPKGQCAGNGPGF